jgi:predicted RNA binding protein YcfA (HicA-like mRNA interferase family)
LEETLACAEMVRHLSEPTYKDDVAPDVWSATQIMLRGWIPTLPASYREGWSVVDDDAFADGRNRLSSQLDEGRVSPRRRHSEWNLAPHGYRGLFNCESVAHVLVPVGAQPLVPWFGGALALPSMSSEDVVKVVQGQGFGIVPRGGKGSHIKLRAAGKPMIIIPANREAVSPAVLRSVATALGVGSIRDLMDLPR